MGQQQLLLLVLGIVIVGLAVVVGIQAFDDANAQAEQDAVRMDLLRISADAKAWAEKPSAFGGNEDSDPATTKYEGLNFNDLGYTDSAGDLLADGVDYVTPNGSYAVTTAGATLVITATHSEGSTVMTVSAAGVASFVFTAS